MSEKNIKDYNLLPANLRVAWGEVRPQGLLTVYTDAKMLVFKRFLSNRVDLALRKRLNPGLQAISIEEFQFLLDRKTSCTAEIKPVALERYPKEGRHLPIINVVCNLEGCSSVTGFNAYKWSWMCRTLKPAVVRVDPNYVYSEAFFLNQNNEVLGILMPVRR
jgi:hypothetical protein